MVTGELIYFEKIELGGKRIWQEKWLNLKILYLFESLSFKKLMIFLWF